MQTVNLEQGSQEWLDYRRDKVGASDVSYLFGENPFCKADDQTKFLIGLKLGFNSIFINSAMQAGNDNEQDIIDHIEEKYGITTQPIVGYVGNISASFDGLTFDRDIVVEVKYSDHTYNIIKKYKKVPKNYYLQVQQQLLVSGAKKAYFAAMSPSTRDVEDIVVERDEKTIEQIQQKINEFYSLMASKKWSEDDFSEERNDLDWIDACYEYKELKEAENALNARIESSKERLIALAGGTRSKGSGITVYPVKGRETVDYKSIIKDAGLDIDPKYIKKGKESWSIKVSK